MLLAVGQDLPESGEQLHHGPFSQRSGDVAQLDQSVQQGAGLQHQSEPEPE